MPRPSAALALGRQGLAALGEVSAGFSGLSTSAAAGALSRPATSLLAAATAAARPASTKVSAVLVTPEEAAALSRQAFATSPASLPTLTSRRGPGPTVVGRITRLAGPWAWVDAGLKRPARMARSELKASQLVLSMVDASSGGRVEEERTGEADAPAAPADPLASASSSSSSAAAAAARRVRAPGDVRLGDALRFHVSAFATPYGGEPLLAPDALPRGGGPAPAAARLRSAWREIVAAAQAGTPILGRVLNVSGAGGYAVGLGGFVGFMPFSRAQQARAARVLGSLQPFYVLAASVVPGGGAAGGGGRVNIVVSDAPTQRRRLLMAKAASARKAAGLPPAPGDWWGAARGEGGGPARPPFRRPPRGGQEAGEGGAPPARLPHAARRAAAGRPPRSGAAPKEGGGSGGLDW